MTEIVSLAALTKAAQEIAMKIGQFYLAKHDNNYALTKRELEQLQITNLKVTKFQEKQPSEIEIHLGRPGILIGRKGTNIAELQRYLNIEIKIIEAECWLNWLVPYNPADEDDYL